MLTHKASSTQCCSPGSDDDSDWEVLSGEVSDRESDISSSSSDEGDRGSGSLPRDRLHLSLNAAHEQERNEPVDGVASNLSVKVGFHTPGKLLRNFEEVVNHIDTNTTAKNDSEGTLDTPHSSLSSLHPVSPSIHIMQKSISSVEHSPANQSDKRKAYPTLCEDDNYSSTDTESDSHRNLSAVQGKLGRDSPRPLHRYVPMTTGSFSSSHNALMKAVTQNLRRGNSVIVRGERAGELRESGFGLPASAVLWKTSPLSLIQSASGSQ